MRKYLPFVTLMLLIALFYSQPFRAQNSNALPQSNASFNHDLIESGKAKDMKEYFKTKGRPKEHEFTKFNREELIKELTNMQGVDTVKFIIGAFMTDEGNGRKPGKPVIMLQIVETGKEQPGGYAATYKYMQGSICPPPNGVCALEQAQ